MFLLSHLDEAQIPLGSTRHDTILSGRVLCRDETRRNVSSFFQHGRRRSDGDRVYYRLEFCALDVGLHARNIEKRTNKQMTTAREETASSA